MDEPNAPPAAPRLLTIGQAAAMLGVTERTIRRWGTLTPVDPQLVPPAERWRPHYDEAAVRALMAPAAAPEPPDERAALLAEAERRMTERGPR